jgi:hypothetical protein
MAEAISKDVKLQSFAVVPAVKIAGFRFTGATEFQSQESGRVRRSQKESEGVGRGQ